MYAKWGQRYFLAYRFFAAVYPYGQHSSLREMASVSTHYALYTFCVRCSTAQVQQRIEGSLNPARPATMFAFGLPLSEEDTPPCCSRRV